MLRLTLAFGAGTLFALWLSWSLPVSADPCLPGIQPQDMPSRWLPQTYSEVTPLMKPYVSPDPGFRWEGGKPTY